MKFIEVDRHNNVPWPEIPAGYAQLIVADPNWSFRTYSPKGWKKTCNGQYHCDPVDFIGFTYPVWDLAAPDCLLLLWGTWPLIDKQIECMRAWGFRYSTAFVWRKLTKHGKPAIGTGYRQRSMAEPVLIGVRGRPKHKAFDGCFDGERRQHSRKPESFFHMIDRCCPDLPRRVELFSRQRRDGWLTWGDQSDKFDAS